MPEQSDEQQLWAAVVAAEQEGVRRRAEFYQHARARADTIAAALAGGGWDQRAALTFLAALPDDVPAVLDCLIELSLSERTALTARQAITPAWRAGLLPGLPQKVITRLDRADDIDFRRLAELLKHIHAWDALSELVKRAGTSADPDTREVAEDFAEPKGHGEARPAAVAVD